MGINIQTIFDLIFLTDEEYFAKFGVEKPIKLKEA